MPIGLLMIAMLTGLVLALIWLATGGTILSALGIYVVSGNLTILWIIVRTFARNKS